MVGCIAPRYAAVAGSAKPLRCLPDGPHRSLGFARPVEHRAGIGSWRMHRFKWAIRPGFPDAGLFPGAQVLAAFEPDFDGGTSPDEQAG